MVIPDGIGAHIVGKKGKTILEIKDKHKIQITTKVTNGRETTLTMTGLKCKVDTAETDIKQRIENILAMKEEENNAREAARNEICEHYQTDSCKFGARCWKKHVYISKEEQMPTTNKNLKRKHESRSPRRSRPKSMHKRPSNEWDNRREYEHKEDRYMYHTRSNDENTRTWNTDMEQRQQYNDNRRRKYNEEKAKDRT
jgi:hypothetical protein